MFMDMPQQRRYVLELEMVDSFFKNKMFLFKYDQATIDQLQDFIRHCSWEWWWLLARLERWVSEHATTDKKMDWRLIAINHKGFLDKLEDTYFRGVFNAKGDEKWKGGDDKPKTLFGAVLMHACNAANEWLLAFTSKYTYEQMMWILDSWEFYENMKSEEGQKKNAVKMAKKGIQEMTQGERNKMQAKLDAADKYSLIK